MSNRQVKKIVNHIQVHVNAAENRSDVTEAVNIAVNYGKPVSYDYSVPSTTANILIVACFFISIISLSLASFTISAISILIVILSSIVIFYIGVNKKQLSEIERKIYKWNLLKSNNYKPENLSDFDDIQDDFYEFSLYGHSHKIIDQISGRTGQGACTEPFRYYHVHSSKGSGKKKVIYERYCFVIPFSFYKSIQVSSEKTNPKLKNSWATVSSEFNRRFSVSANTTENASRFLKPAVIEAFQNIPKNFRDLNIELSANNELCFAFSGRDPFSSGRQYDLSKPSDFLDEVSNEVKSKELEEIFDFLHNLIRHSDNNFKNNKGR